MLKADISQMFLKNPRKLNIKEMIINRVARVIRSIKPFFGDEAVLVFFVCFKITEHISISKTKVTPKDGKISKM